MQANSTQKCYITCIDSWCAVPKLSWNFCFIYLILFGSRCVVGFSGGIAVAPSKPREMMKFIIVAVTGGLIGAFLSMFYISVKFRVAWPPLILVLNEWFMTALDFFPKRGFLIELVQFLFSSLVMAALDTCNLSALPERDNRVNAKKALCSSEFLQILVLRQFKPSYHSTSIIDLLLPR